jgi:hypothetical protein
MTWYRTGRFAEANAALFAAANLGKFNASGALVSSRPKRAPDLGDKYRCPRTSMPTTRD